MAAFKLCILAEMYDKLFREAGPFQIFFDLDPLHTDPCIGPWGMKIRFIINKLAGTDEKGIPGAQAEQAASCFVDTRAA